MSTIGEIIEQQDATDPQMATQIRILEVISSECRDFDFLEVLAGAVVVVSVLASTVRENQPDEFATDMTERPVETPEAVAFYDTIEAALRLHDAQANPEAACGESQGRDLRPEQGETT